MLHILRDRRTLLVVLVIPLMLIMLFGFTVSTDVNNIKVIVCAPHRSYAVAQAVNRITASRYFEFKGFVDAGDIDQSLRTRKAAAVVLFADHYHLSGKYQLLLDGADVNTARTSQAYLQSVLSTGNVAVKQSGIQTHMLFNPQMKSSFNFVPGIMGMIFLPAGYQVPPSIQLGDAMRTMEEHKRLAGSGISIAATWQICFSFSAE